MKEFEEPDEVRPKSREVLYCFLNAQRPCTADCVSYLIEGPAGNDYINQKWVHCMLLLNVHRMAKVMDRAYCTYSNSAADARRAGNAPYINVDPVTGRPI